MEYDIQEVRRAAQQIRNAVKALSDISSGDFTKVKADIPGKLHGDAADALIQKVSALVADSKKLSSGLEQVAQELDAFAYRLKLADDAAKKLIKNN